MCKYPKAPEGRHVYSRAACANTLKPQRGGMFIDRRHVLFSLNRGLHGLKDYTDKAENGRWNP